MNRESPTRRLQHTPNGARTRHPLLRRGVGRGCLPGNNMKLLSAWIEIHADELMAEWSGFLP
jgi:hypothetical protein